MDALCHFITIFSCVLFLIHHFICCVHQVRLQTQRKRAASTVTKAASNVNSVSTHLFLTPHFLPVFTPLSPPSVTRLLKKIKQSPLWRQQQLGLYTVPAWHHSVLLSQRLYEWILLCSIFRLWVSDLLFQSTGVRLEKQDTFLYLQMLLLLIIAPPHSLLQAFYYCRYIIINDLKNKQVNKLSY